MAEGMGSAVMPIIPSLKGMTGTIEKQLGIAGKAGGKSAGKGVAGGILGGVKGIVGPVAGLMAAGKVMDFFKDANEEAREAQKIGATTTQIIKATGGAAKVTAKDVGDLASSISAKTGMDDEAIQAGSNLLLTFKNVRNEAGKGSKIFDRATQSAVDLSAAGFGSVEGSSKMLGKALNDPIKGISALGRAGVTFTDQQKEQIKTLVASGDTLGAQKIIMGEVESQVGGVAAASATAGEKLTVAFGNFKEQVGTALLPVIDKVAGVLTEKALPALSSFVGFVSDNAGPALGKLKEFFTPIGNAIKGVADILIKGDFNGALFRAFKIEEDSPIVGFLFGVRDAVRSVFGVLTGDGGKASGFLSGTLIPALQGIAAAAQPMIAAFVGKILPAIRSVAGTVISFAMTAAPLVLDAFKAIVGFIVTQVVPKFMAIQGAVMQLYSVIAPIIAEIAGFLVAKFKEALPQIRVIISTIGTIFMDIWAVVGPALDRIKIGIQIVTTVISYIWSRWGGTIKTVVGSVFKTVIAVIGGAMKIVSGVVKVITGVMTGDWKKAGQGIKTIVAGIKQIVVAIWKNIQTQITAILGGLITTIKTKLANLVTWAGSTFKAGISKVTTFITAPVRLARDAIPGIVTTIKTRFSSLTTWASTTFKNALAKINSFITAPARLARDAIPGIITSVKTRFSSVTTWASTTFKNAMAKVEGYLLNPLRKARDTAGAIVKSFGDKIMSAAKVPIRFFVSTVINHGLLTAFNKLARTFGINEIKWLTLPKGFSAGTANTGGRPNEVRGPVHGDEAVIKSPSRRRFEKKYPGYLHAINVTGDLPHRAGGPHLADVGESGGGSDAKSAARAWPTNTRSLSPNYGGHSGVDIRAGGGAPIYAAEAGRISYTGWGRGYGQAIFERGNGGMEQVYGHTSKVETAIGAIVRAGQLIGRVGSTGRSSGNHLHYERAYSAFGSASNRNPTLSWLNGAKDAPGSGAGDGSDGGGLDIVGLLSGLKNKVAGPVKSIVSKFGNHPFIQLISGVGSKIGSALVDKAKNALGTVTEGVRNWVGDLIPGWGKDQLDNASTIISVAKQLGFGDRGAKIGLITSIVESNLRNLGYGDRDSVGLFQQRAPWGPRADRMNPAKSAAMFFNGGQGGQPGLRSKNWQRMGMGEAAQAVQVSAFPDRYAARIGQAEKLLSKAGGYATGVRHARKGLAVVGEQGREVVDFGNGGQRVLTNSETERGMTQQAIQVHQHFPTTADPSAAAAAAGGRVAATLSSLGY